MNQPKNRLHVMPIMAAALGLGLSAYYGEQWYRLPQYSAEDLSASVELNLAMDLERRAPDQQPSPEERERLRQQIRSEIDADISRERKTVHQGFATAALMLLFGGGYLALRLRQRF